MVLIVNFQFISFFWLSFQTPFLSCFMLPELLMQPNLLVLLSTTAFTTYTCTSLCFIIAQAFDAGGYLDMLFINSPRFPEKTSFFQLIRIPNSTFSFIQFSFTNIAEQPTMCQAAGQQQWGPWSLDLQTGSSHYCFRQNILTPPPCFSLFHDKLHILDKQHHRPVSNQLCFPGSSRPNFVL